MLNWLANVFCLVLELPRKMTHATVGRHFARKWWNSHYR